MPELAKMTVTVQLDDIPEIAAVVRASMTLFACHEEFEERAIQFCEEKEDAWSDAVVALIQRRETAHAELDTSNA